MTRDVSACLASIESYLATMLGDVARHGGEIEARKPLVRLQGLSGYMDNERPGVGVASWSDIGAATADDERRLLPRFDVVRHCRVIALAAGGGGLHDSCPWQP